MNGVYSLKYLHHFDVFYTYGAATINFRVGKKHVFFLFKTKHTVFFILNSFFLFKTCFKPILNTNKTELNWLKSLLCCCIFTLDHWDIAMQTAKLPKFGFLIIFSCYL
jgi:hypothetical protein